MFGGVAVFISVHGDDGDSLVDGASTHPAAYSSLDMSKSWEMAKPDTHLYDQVDKGEKGEVDTVLDTVQVLVVMGSHQPVQTPPPVFCLMVSSPHSLD